MAGSFALLGAVRVSSTLPSSSAASSALPAASRVATASQANPDLSHVGGSASPCSVHCG
jgi:hypothetical protein